MARGGWLKAQTKAKPQPGAKRRKPPEPLAIQLEPAASHGTARFIVKIVGWHPYKLNELDTGHWTGRRRKKEADALCVARMLKLKGVTAAIGKRRLHYEIILGKGQRSGDSDAYDKSLRDALKRCGALIDDSPKWLEPTVPGFGRREPVKAIIITLEDV